MAIINFLIIYLSFKIKNNKIKLFFIFIYKSIDVIVIEKSCFYHSSIYFCFKSSKSFFINIIMIKKLKCNDNVYYNRRTIYPSVLIQYQKTTPLNRDLPKSCKSQNYIKYISK